MISLLVVEDHALVREGLVQTLHHLDGEVAIYEAADSDSANLLLERQQGFDLMLLDLGLPGLDGLSYLATLRKRYPDLPVVILSAYDDSHTVNKAMRCGGGGFRAESLFERPPAGGAARGVGRARGGAGAVPRSLRNIRPARAGRCPGRALGFRADRAPGRGAGANGAR